MKYEEKIHSKQFRVVARQLADPQTPIEAVLHVKSVALLAVLAEKIEMLATNPRTTTELIRALEPMLREKAVLLSFAKETPAPLSEFSIPTSAIRPSAWSKVLYMPPFYLGHTPGLFEEMARQDQTANEICHVPQPHRPLRFKM